VTDEAAGNGLAGAGAGLRGEAIGSGAGAGATGTGKFLGGKGGIVKPVEFNPALKSGAVEPGDSKGIWSKAETRAVDSELSARVTHSIGKGADSTGTDRCQGID